MALLKQVLDYSIIHPSPTSQTAEEVLEDSAYTAPTLINDKAPWTNPNCLTVIPPSQLPDSSGFFKAARKFFALQRVHLGNQLKRIGNADLHHDIGTGNKLALKVQSVQKVALAAGGTLQVGFSGAAWGAKAEREALASIVELRPRIQKSLSSLANSVGETEVGWDDCL